MESSFRTLKVEEVYMSNYETFEDMLESIQFFIKEVHNRKRVHSSLDIYPLENLNISLIKKVPSVGPNIVKYVSNFWSLAHSLTFLILNSPIYQ
ncbi:MAG: hypothetical protein IMZ60_03620 [Actinobacteria bacterium]|nr:hypothetical protein [Chloroflexota bacterium]MBE3128752.1 hypothetical protein [Actinomycetota bacterium]